VVKDNLKYSYIGKTAFKKSSREVVVASSTSSDVVTIGSYTDAVYQAD